MIYCLEHFSRILGIKSIVLEALFYHNAIVYEKYGFSYLEGFHRMKRIHELFQPGNILCEKLDGSSPFRQIGFHRTIRGRSWAIHDGILGEVDDEVIEGAWYAPKMYKMVDKPRKISEPFVIPPELSFEDIHYQIDAFSINHLNDLVIITLKKEEGLLST